MRVTELRARWTAWGVACATMSLLSACGGGGGGTGTPPANTAPVADAGADLTVFRNSTVTLDASRSSDADGNTLGFKWTQTSGPAVALSSDTAARPTFTAPRFTGTLAFSLVVGDGRTTSGTDNVSILIQNRVPVANAGADAALRLGAETTLDGRTSSDPDGDPLAYTWTQVGGSATVALQPNADGTAALPAQAAPRVLVYGLRVSDGELISAQDEITISISPTGNNTAPAVDAGLDRDVSLGAAVILSGFAQDPDFQPIAVRWTQISGPGVSLDTQTGFNPQFTAPTHDAVLTFELRATDASLEASDTVEIRVHNLAPDLSASITPFNPGVLDPLSANAFAQDPEGLPVTLTYAWLRNGAAIAGAVTPTLPAGNYVRGDVVTVSVTASDGEASRSTTASVTIQDTLPILSSDAPAIHPFANPLEFQVTAVDPDGDPVQLALHHGPPGMVVSPAGLVTWTPNLPMFSNALDVSWGVVVVGFPAARLNGAVQVTDALHEPLMRRTLLQMPLTMHGMLVADLDSDGAPEILASGASALYELRRDGATYFQDWVYPFALGNSYLEGVLAIAAGKIDGDAYQEIFATTGSHTVAIDGLSRLPLREFDPGPNWACKDIAVADLEGNGSLELVCAALSEPFIGDTRIVVFDAATGGILHQSPSFGGYQVRLAIGNFDGDAAFEIALSSGVVYDGATFANQWLTTPFGLLMAAADVDGDGVDELVASDAAAGAVRAYDVVDRTILWEIPDVQPRSLLAVDIDGDDTTEILLGDETFRMVRGYHRDAAGAAQEVLTFDAQEGNVRAIAVGDVDGDSDRELVWAAGFGRSVFGVASLAATPTIEWSQSDLITDRTLYAGGALATVAPGTRRLVYAANRPTDGGPARFLSLDPATGRVTASAANLELSFGGLADVAVVDYDRDGVDEAFLAHDRTYSVLLTAYDIDASQIERQFDTNVSIATGIGSTRIAQPADANNDGFADLIALTSSGHVSAYDVRNSTLIWRSSTAFTTQTRDVETGDLDGDGRAEIVAATQGRIVVFAQGAAPNTFVQTAEYNFSDPFSFVHDLLVADADGDSHPEIYMLMGNFGATFVRRFDAQLVEQSSFTVDRFATALALEDIGASRKNLVIGSDGNSAEAFIGLQAVDAISGDVIWTSPALPSAAVDTLYYVDVDGDGRKELSFGGREGMFLAR